MSDKQFISNLSSTYADVRKLDAKKINLKGKNILEYISDSEFNSYDTRDTQLKNDELDIWNTKISLSDNRHIEVKPLEHTFQTIPSTTRNIIRNAFTVRNNEVFDADNNHVMYWQTDGLTDGGGIFGQVTNIVTFDSDMPSLTKANDMFTYTPTLTSFNGDLSSLVEAKNMFFISELTSFTSDLSSLQNGNSMFAECYNLSDFTCKNLDSLTHGNGMFAYTNITSFEMNLSSLVEGDEMFSSCPNLSTFIGDLSSLEYGDCMFSDCKLDAQSVANIIHFIPQRDTKPTTTTNAGNITIGLGITNTDAAKQAFAEECYCDSWEELNKEFDDKNWAVEWQFNGSASYSLRDPRPSIAVYAKLEEVIMPTDKKAHKPHYTYTSQDCTKFYNIHWYHDSNTNNEGYDYFDSLEEAISAYGVIHK